MQLAETIRTPQLPCQSQLLDEERAKGFLSRYRDNTNTFCTKQKSKQNRLPNVIKLLRLKFENYELFVNDKLKCMEIFNRESDCERMDKARQTYTGCANETIGRLTSIDGALNKCLYVYWRN